MKQVGFIGLGIMGKPMAMNLIKKGFRLVVVGGRAVESVKEIKGKDVVVVNTPMEVAQRSDIVVTCVPDSKDVEEVYLGRSGLLEGVKPGMTLIDMSTISPHVAQRVSAEVEKKGAKMLDAPVTGGQKGAIEGTLTIMVGGDAEALSKCMGVLQAMGKTIVHVGSSGAGQYTKAANQVIAAVTWQGIAEGMALACKAGVDPDRLLEVLTNGAARCWALEVRMPNVLEGKFEPGFKAKLQYKDLGIALEEGRRLEVPMPAVAMVNEFFKAVVHEGKGEWDVSSLVTFTENLAGTEIRSRKRSD
ncbi:MAG: NAD(P)-dependent oxidoreductase [Thaumarchaeota archaeon]|nr:NAD(P)-dependent oxidoreductase [Nitrososphaerota archaeon]